MTDSSLKSQAESTPTPQRGVKRKIDRTTDSAVGGTEDIPVGSGYHAKLLNASDYASVRIIRAFTPEQTKEYKALTGRGASQKKTEMRIHLASMALKLGKASGLQTNTLSDTQSDVKVGKLGMVVNWMLVAELGGMEKPNDDANKASQRREGWRQLTEKRVDQDKPLVIDATMRSKMSAFKEAWAKDALVNPMAEQTPQEAWANEASAQARWAKAHGKAAVLANGYWSIAELRCDEKKKRVMAKADKNTDPYKSYNDDQVDEPSSPP